MFTTVKLFLLHLSIFLFVQNCTGFSFTFDVQLKAGTTWWNGYARKILVYKRDDSIVLCTSKDGNNRVHSFSDVFDYTCGQYHLYWDGNQNTANGRFIQTLRALVKQLMKRILMTLMMMCERVFGTELMLVMLKLKRVMIALLLNLISRFN